MGGEMLLDAPFDPPIASSPGGMAENLKNQCLVIFL
jgi:hypothetical protein